MYTQAECSSFYLEIKSAYKTDYITLKIKKK